MRALIVLLSMLCLIVPVWGQNERAELTPPTTTEPAPRLADGSINISARSGEQVYNTFCAACHTSGVMGAPKINNAEDWEPRLAQGMDTVLKHAIEGYNAMPPKGTCSDCSDDEIQAAIDYMIAGI